MLGERRRGDRLNGSRGKEGSQRLDRRRGERINRRRENKREEERR